MDALIGLLWLVGVTGFVWLPFAVMIFLDHFVFERRARPEELPPLQPRLPEEQPTQPQPKELQ